MRTIGIMAAMHGEISALLQKMGSVRVTRIGMRDYHQGVLHGWPCVVVLARLGKVAAAATAVTLIREFDVQQVFFAGLAGGISQNAGIGDVVVGTTLLQYDLDASPLFPRHEIPLLALSYIQADPDLSGLLNQAAEDYFAFDWERDISAETREAFQLMAPEVHQGLIASGDQFVSSSSAAQALREMLPDVLCVEMEGASVAQICYEYGTPFAILRTVSDRADDHAIHDFNRFLTHVASHYSAGILERTIKML